MLIVMVISNIVKINTTFITFIINNTYLKKACNSLDYGFVFAINKADIKLR